MKRIEAVIFDWAGTTVDYGCMAPIEAMKGAFSAHDLPVTLGEIRKPMGMLKVDHIQAVLAMDRVSQLFKQVYGRYPDQQDVARIYQHFENNILSILPQHAQVIDGVLKVQDYLRDANIKIGSTTGYTKDMITVVAKSAAIQGYQPDYIVSSDQVKNGRPYPYMLQQNLAMLNVKDISTVVKVGDTLVDIEEGVYAGCWTVGVIKGSSMLGLTQQEVESMQQHDLHHRIRQIKYEFLAAGADFVIDTIDELPWVIDVLQHKLNHTVIKAI